MLGGDEDEAIACICLIGKPASTQGMNVGSRTQRAFASDVVKHKRVLHCSDMGALMMERSTSERYAVTHFPKENCQYRSTTTCNRIMAGKLVVSTQERRVVNLSQLKRNIRKSVNKNIQKERTSIWRLRCRN